MRILVLSLLALLAGACARADTWILGLDDPDPDLLVAATPFYRIEIQRDPVRIRSIQWDHDGGQGYWTVGVEELPNTQWKSTLYAGVGGFTNVQAGTAQAIVRHPDGRSATITGIPLTAAISADWHFEFHRDRIEHEITWIATTPQSSLLNLGHQIVTPLVFAGDDVSRTRSGDQPGFSRHVQAFDDNRVLRETFVEGSTTLQGNRYFSGVSILWQNIFGSGLLPAGRTSGGRFILRGLTPDEAWVRSTSQRIGLFERAGEYMKDFTFVKDGDTWHLFYNVGNADGIQDWQQPGNEKAFGHATSTDLNNWTHHPRVMDVVPGTWEGMVVSAPTINKDGALWKMMYTGFDSAVIGLQQNGLATSPDLFTWTRHPSNPVHTGPAWTNFDPTRWSDCRDPDVVFHDGSWLMYYTAYHEAQAQYAIGIARSTDFVNWEDLGPACLRAQVMESPQVFEKDGMWFLLNSSTGMSLYRSPDPTSNNWEEVPFTFPPQGFWAGWEVHEDDGQWIASAFQWKLFGNHIHFWEMDWVDGLPVVRY